MNEGAAIFVCRWFNANPVKVGGRLEKDVPLVAIPNYSRSLKAWTVLIALPVVAKKAKRKRPVVMFEGKRVP